MNSTVTDLRYLRPGMVELVPTSVCKWIVVFCFSAVFSPITVLAQNRGESILVAEIVVKDKYECLSSTCTLGQRDFTADIELWSPLGATAISTFLPGDELPGAKVRFDSRSEAKITPHQLIAAGASDTFEELDGTEVDMFQMDHGNGGSVKTAYKFPSEKLFVDLDELPMFLTKLSTSRFNGFTNTDPSEMDVSYEKYWCTRDGAVMRCVFRARGSLSAFYNPWPTQSEIQ